MGRMQGGLPFIDKNQETKLCFPNSHFGKLKDDYLRGTIWTLFEGVAACSWAFKIIFSVKQVLYFYIYLIMMKKTIFNSYKLLEKAMISTYNQKLVDKKRFFSNNSTFSMNNPNLNPIKKKLETLSEKGKELQQEHEDLKSDKEMTKVHRLALVKKENNQTINQEEEDAISDIKENYLSYFDEALDESDPEVETSPEYKERKQLSQVVEYINEELKSNRDEMEKLKLQ